jgi:hypothetical protein
MAGATVSREATSDDNGLEGRLALRRGLPVRSLNRSLNEPGT